MHYPPHLLKLIDSLRRLPGVGSRTAERYAFHLLTWSPEKLTEMAQVIAETPEQVKQCGACGCLMDGKACSFCDLKRRETETICVIASPKDAFAIEHTHEYKGLYHVLGGLLSPIEGKDPQSLGCDKLRARIRTHNIKEVVLALDSTLEGDATALFLKKDLEPLSLHVSRLALGLPMGSSLDYVDGGTLARALSGRHAF